MKKKMICIGIISIFLLISINFFSVDGVSICKKSIQELNQNKIIKSNEKHASISLRINNAYNLNYPNAMVWDFFVDPYINLGDRLTINATKQIEIFCAGYYHPLVGYYKAYITDGENVLFTTDKIYFDSRDSDSPSCTVDDSDSWIVDSARDLTAYVEVDYDIYDPNGNYDNPIGHRNDSEKRTIKIPYNRQKISRVVFIDFLKDYIQSTKLLERLIKFRNS